MQPRLFLIGTSKALLIQMGGRFVGWDWNPSAVTGWTNFAKPTPYSKTKVTYNKTTKNAAGKATGWYAGGITRDGTTIPRTVTLVIDGVETAVEVRYQMRGYTIYSRPKDLEKKKKMYRTVYDPFKVHPYQYRLQYKSKKIIDYNYSENVDGTTWIKFADHFYNSTTWQRVDNSGWMMHPQKFEVTYMDVNKNVNYSANNSSNRDNLGNYILTNVRANLVKLDLEWNGLSQDDGAQLLQVLNPTKLADGQHNYVIVQFLDPASNKPVNKTFFCSDRKAVPYANGGFESISVTLEEV